MVLGKSLALRQDVGGVGAGGAEEVVVGKDLGEGRVAEEEGEEVVVAVFENLTVDGGFFAALDEDEEGAPAGQVFDHELMLKPVELCEPGRLDGVLGGWAGLVAEDGGEHPEVGVALGEGEVVAEGGRNGVVDRRGEGGDGGTGRERGEEGRVGGELGLLDAAWGLVELGEVGGEGQGEEGDESSK